MNTKFVKPFGLLCVLFLALVSDLNAQLNFLPQGSQYAKVTQRVGISDISIEYSRPKVNGREIWGALIPYGLIPNNFGTAKEIPWRAGANDNTVISFPTDVKIEGQTLAAGSYSLHMILQESGDVTIIFNKNTAAWGSFFYVESDDALRVNVTSSEAPHHELLTFEFTETGANSTTLALLWGKKAIPFKIEVPTTELVLQKIENELTGRTGFSRQSWEQAAGYALGAGENEKALAWIDAAIEGNFFSQKTYQNLSTKSAILKGMGKQAEADKLMEEAISMANTNQLNNLGYQLLGQNNYPKAIEVFKLNVKNNPSDANAYDSLGEGYKISGDKENAIKNLKKSLTLNPTPAVKANTVKLLKELGVAVAE